MGAVRVLLVVVLGLLAAGCGGGDEPSSDDLSTIRVMLRSGADVQRAVQPLFFCLPEEPECYRQVGPGIVEVVEREGKAVDVAVADTDDACIKEAASLYRDSLERYTEAGRAAAEGDTTAADAAISKTTALEIAYTQKIGECGFVEGRMAEYSAALREANVTMLRLGEEMTACTDEACLFDVAARGGSAATEAVTAVDGLLRQLAEEDEEIPTCLADALRELRGAYQAVQNTMEAIEALDYATAEREGTRAGELEAQAQEDMAACIGSAGF